VAQWRRVLPPDHRRYCRSRPAGGGQYLAGDFGASLESALTAGLWSAGSLNGVTWAKSLPVLAVIALCCLLLLMLARRMRLLEMGDDTACALGVPVERSRVLLLLVGVTLTAAATAVAGPISFIALVAPQIARRLCANQSAVLLLTALTGALLLLLLADVAAQRLFPALSVAGRGIDREPGRHLPDLAY
jgi:ferric enterobactin transport system permease protein